MYWSNYHSHCTFCDGRSSMEDFVRFAISKGIKKYGFSSHAPLPFQTKWNMEKDNFNDYQIEFQRLKNKYENQIELFFSLEVDYIHDFVEIQNCFINGKSFDYLIGSIHYLEPMSYENYFCIDGDIKEFDKGLQQLYDGDIQLAVKRFFEITNLMIEKGGLDIIGHFDKISFNAAYYKDFDITSLWYKNIISSTLECIKAKNILLEINTKSLNEKGITFPHQQFFPMINDLQIPIVVNSDCHYPTNVIDGFIPAYKMLKNNGFTHLHQLINGKWQGVEFCEAGMIE
ncbi:MAG: histidinol-phosphatase [Paludibacter sp.]